MTQRLSSQHRHKRKTRPNLQIAGGLVGPEPATAGVAPTFAMRDPDDPRSSIISGSITTALHVGAFALLFLLAWLAPPVDVLIPVRIIRELPGAKPEPAPARKILKRRRQVRPVHAPRRVTARTVTQPRVVKMSAEQLRLAKVAPAVAPQIVERRQVVSHRTSARAVSTRRVATNIDLSKLSATAVPTDLSAPMIDYDGPRDIDPGAALVDPENLAEVPDVAPVDYSSAAPFEIAADSTLPEDLEALEFDVEVGIFASGDGTGGTGNAVDTVRCLESAPVVRYLKKVVERTKRRWNVPPDTPAEFKVRLKFTLDASGTATRVEVADEANAALGNSAAAALRAGSPFPSMDASTRCLADMRLLATFDHSNL